MISLNDLVMNCRAFGMATGALLSLALLSALIAGKQTRFENAAFDEKDAYFAVSDGVRIHCKDLTDANECLSNDKISKARSKYLWLGNSQLNTINQRSSNDRNAPELLHEKMRQSFKYVVTFSQPNANLQEHLILFAYLLPRLHPEGLILPVVFDDFRETGIRGELQTAFDDTATRHALAESEIGRRLLSEATAGTNSDDDLAGIAATVQEKTERFLTTWLTDHWDLWAVRPEARGRIFLALYQLRNTVLGIKPTTVRQVLPGRFADNWAALEAIVSIAEREGIRVFLYIVPLRNDVEIPYDKDEYAAFKARTMNTFASRSIVRVANFENVVANDLWGTKAATTVGDAPEYDFMHFKGQGHQALSDAVFAFVTTGLKPTR